MYNMILLLALTAQIAINHLPNRRRSIYNVSSAHSFHTAMIFPSYTATHAQELCTYQGIAYAAP